MNELHNIKIIQPNLSTSLFYAIYNELKINDLNIYNKLIKKETYTISLNSLNHFYFIIIIKKIV